MCYSVINLHFDFTWLQKSVLMVNWKSEIFALVINDDVLWVLKVNNFVSFNTRYSCCVEDPFVLPRTKWYHALDENLLSIQTEDIHFNWSCSIEHSHFINSENYSGVFRLKHYYYIILSTHFYGRYDQKYFVTNEKIWFQSNHEKKLKLKVLNLKLEREFITIIIFIFYVHVQDTNVASLLECESSRKCLLMNIY